MKKTKNTLSNIWLITREYDGLAGAGGVKDVCRQLAQELSRSVRVSVCLPLYGFMTPQPHGFRLLDQFQVDMNYVGEERREDVRIWCKQSKSDKNHLTLYLVDSPRYQEKKSVYTYTLEEEAEDPTHVQGSGHYDYFAMNILLQKSAISLMLLLNERPDVIHCHDGHTALIPAMVRENAGYRHFFRNTGLVVTIHNAGTGYHQEIADLPFAKSITGLPGNVVAKNLLDGRFDPFIAASSYAVLNTVSENYARELRETDDDELTDWLGHFLASRGVTLSGITNGISPDDFDPSHPEQTGIAAAYSPELGDLKGKEACKRDLIRAITQKELSSVLAYGSLSAKQDLPLLTFIGRFSSQKGVDKLIGALETLLPMDAGFQVLILGTGSKDIEKGLIRLSEMKANRGRICVLLGYDPLLANRTYAAGDFFLIPSRYEPCGLTDYIAQLFGSIPIVHHIGGLVKVIDSKTGFVYHDHSSAALMGAMQRALKVYRQKPSQIRKMQKTAIKTIKEQYTWEKVVQRYLKLYASAVKMSKL
jgi:starch synthase